MKPHANSESDIKHLFESKATINPLVNVKTMGRRITGFDLIKPLSTEQANLVTALLNQYSIVIFSNQKKTRISAKRYGTIC